MVTKDTRATELRYDLRTVDGVRYLRGWVKVEGLWHVAYVKEIEGPKGVTAGELSIMEEDLCKRYLGSPRDVRHEYARPWLRDELGKAKGNGSYMIFESDLEELER